MYIKVHVKAGAKHESIIQKSTDHFDISVKEEAEHNYANKRILQLISYHYLIPAGYVKIISGHHSPHKILSVESVNQ